MRIEITEDDMTVHVHTEEIPPVQVVNHSPYNDILAIGERSIEHGEGFNVLAVDRKHYEDQLLEAIAAIRWYDKEQHE